LLSRSGSNLNLQAGFWHKIYFKSNKRLAIFISLQIGRNRLSEPNQVF